MQSTMKSSNSSALLFLLALFGLPLVINPVLSLNFNDVFLNIKAIWCLAVILPSAAYLIYINRAGLGRRDALIFVSWLGLLTLAASMSGRGWLSITGAPDRLQGLPIYLTYASVALAAYTWSRREAQAGAQLAQALSWLIVPLSIYVALQHYGIVGLLNGNAVSGVAPSAAGATLGNRGYLAGCMALLLPLAAAFASHSRWGLLCVFLAGFSLTASFTRGALLAAALGYILWLVQGNARQYAVHAALLLGLFTPLVHLSTGQLGTRDFGTGAGQQRLSDGSARSPLWNTALYGIHLRPVFGWGTGQLLDVMAQRPDHQLLGELQVPFAGRTVVRLPRSVGGPLQWRVVGGGHPPVGVLQNINAVHNEYLEYAFTFGIPAALAFVALFLTGFFRSWKRLPWAAASIAAYLVYLLTWPETVRFAPLAWAVLGFALASTFRPPVFSSKLPTT